MIHNFDVLVERAKNKQKRLAVAAAEDEHVLQALKKATENKIVNPILVGNREKIEQISQKIGFNLADVSIVDNRDGAVESAKIAVSLVKKGEADILMKGFVATGDFLRAVLDRENGIRKEKVLSHISFFQSPYYHKLLCITDVAMNIAPDLETKVELIKNAVQVCHKIGIECPKVAAMAAVETVNPKMEATVHAAELKKMKWDGCIVDGPYAIDLAVNKEAADHKGIHSEVAGDVDVILAPNIEAGNMFYKALNFLGGAVSVAIVSGASVPIVVTSRSDNEKSKFLSIAFAAAME